MADGTDDEATRVWLADLDSLLERQHARRPWSRLVADLLPDPARSLEEYRRLKHEDLVQMTTDQLRWEQQRVRHALVVVYQDVEEAPPWLRDRGHQLAAELRRRRLVLRFGHRSR